MLSSMLSALRADDSIYVIRPPDPERLVSLVEFTVDLADDAAAATPRANASATHTFSVACGRLGVRP